MTRKLFFNVLKFVFFLSVGVFLLWLITKDFSADDRQKLLDAFKQANYWWVAVSIAIGILSHIIRSLRWKMMLEPLGRSPRLNTIFYSVMVGYLVNMAIPRLGEITRCGIVQRYEKISFDKSIGTIIVERSIDLLSLIIITLLLFATQFNVMYHFFDEKVIQPLSEKIINSSTALIITGIALLILVVIAWLLIRRFKHTDAFVRFKILLLNVRDGVYSIRHMKNKGLFLFYSFAMWVCYFLMVRLCFFAMDATSHFGFAEGLAVLVFGTVGIISTPGGIGAYQLIVTETLITLYGLDKINAAAFSWLVWSCQTVMIIIIGVTSLLLLARHPQKEELQHEKA